MTQLLLNVIIGGDAHYMMNARFLMSVAGPMALLSCALSRAETERVAVSSILLVAWAACVGGNCLEMRRPQSDFHPEWNGLTTLLPASRSLLVGEHAGLDAKLSELRANLDNPTFDGQVGHHLARTLPAGDTLASGSAGEIAWIWPGRFRDTLGLIAPAPYPFGPVEGPSADWWLLWPKSFPEHGRQLRQLGLRLERVYVYADVRDEDFGTYALLSRRPSALELTDDLFEPSTGSLSFSRIPLSRRIVFSSVRPLEPVFDGPAGATKTPYNCGWLPGLEKCLSEDCSLADRIGGGSPPP